MHGDVDRFFGRFRECVSLWKVMFGSSLSPKRIGVEWIVGTGVEEVMIRLCS